jgi:hypothetical protein
MSILIVIISCSKFVPLQDLISIKPQSIVIKIFNYFNYFD